MIESVRPPAVADMFYPGEVDELQHMLTAFLKNVQLPDDHSTVPKAIVAPHAGYIYSGPIAATANQRGIAEGALGLVTLALTAYLAWTSRNRPIHSNQDE